MCFFPYRIPGYCTVKAKPSTPTWLCCACTDELGHTQKNPASGVFVTAPQRFHLVGAQQESLVGLRVSRPFGILLISLHRVFFLQSATVSDDFWQHHCSGEHSTDLARECAAKDGANNQRVSSPVLPRTCEGARCQECQSAAATDDVACHCQSAQFQTDS